MGVFLLNKLNVFLGIPVNIAENIHLFLDFMRHVIWILSHSGYAHCGYCDRCQRPQRPRHVAFCGATWASGLDGPRHLGQQTNGSSFGLRPTHFCVKSAGADEGRGLGLLFRSGRFVVCRQQRKRKKRKFQWSDDTQTRCLGRCASLMCRNVTDNNTPTWGWDKNSFSQFCPTFAVFWCLFQILVKYFAPKKQCHFVCWTVDLSLLVSPDEYKHGLTIPKTLSLCSAQLPEPEPYLITLAGP